MIYNLGSINADHTYRVPHLPAPGETIAALSISRGLGGKGANQSVAAALAGSEVCHIGAIGQDGDWALDALNGFGVATDRVMKVNAPTAHAIINVDAEGENAIVIFPGANQEQSLTQVESALADAKPRDILLLQNETNLQIEAAKLAQSIGMFVIYSAAPFSADAVANILPHIDLLVTNAVEAAELTVAPQCHQIITRGADGADWKEKDQIMHAPAFSVDPVDTTGAGDCFIGYVAAGLDQGLSPNEAMRLGSAASALQVQKIGTADAIPARAEVDLFLS